MFNINRKETRNCKIGKDTKLSFLELEKCELVNSIPVVLIFHQQTPGSISVLRGFFISLCRKYEFIDKMPP